jgi:alkanesulfonate monooxygenase SsuD/methylene tetrahydromethanopterin reductase-like flavin-dependent oxidoreductase (luciferase family)
MKIRIGVGLGPAPVGDGAGLAGVVDDLVELGFDSIWLPEILTAPTIDPLVGLAYAAAHNQHVKLGTTILLPGHNPVRLAKQLAGLDRLSGGRLLVTFVPGLSREPEAGAVGVSGGAKGRLMDEMLPLVRRLWAGETVSHHGDGVHFDGVTLSPLPVQQPLEFWTGWHGSRCPPSLRSVRRRMAPFLVYSEGGGGGPDCHRRGG